MTRFNPLIVLAVLLICVPLPATGQDSDESRELVVIFSNNIQGELAPCG